MINTDPQPHTFTEDHSARLETHIVAQAEFFDHSRILLVNRDRKTREMHSALLEMDGYVVESADDGGTAVRMLMSGRFDLVIIERQTPVLGGETMVVALRSLGIRIPIIMFSSPPVDAPMSPCVAREVSVDLVMPICASQLSRAVFHALYRADRGTRIAA